MELRVAKRMARSDFQAEFVSMMLKKAQSGDIISFAGGLPNPASFPVDALASAARHVLLEQGSKALQYSDTAGYAPLRELIAGRYRGKGLAVTADDIIITNGSQQGLDMVTGVLVDDGDAIVAERPSYLAALQAFHFYGARVQTVELTEQGASPDELAAILKRENPKFFYTVPDFQNPTGLTYSDATRRAIADVLCGSSTFLVEDNPYGELRFKGQPSASFHTLLGDQCLLLGTFSKIVSPGVRLGWIACTCTPLRELLMAYKQRVDLHSSMLDQMILARYLTDNDLDAHIEKIKKLYGHQAKVMLDAMDHHFPEGTRYTRPDGGMFLWVTLPHGIKAVPFAEEAARAGVAVAAGDPFYETDRGVSTLRMNYTNCDDATIEKGIAILGDVIRRMAGACEG